MLRYFFLLLLVLCVSLLFLNGRLHSTNSDKPIFLKYDGLANEHQSIVDVKINAAIPPNKEQVEVLKKDYTNIWAHLNHLYATKDVVAGKEYYTEAWFKQICLEYKSTTHPIIHRKDLSHQLIIKNWAWDGLVCTLTDSVKIAYIFPDKNTSVTYLNISMVLLYEGDHWRIDAIKAEN
jgi:hypothetical protein